MLANVWTSGLPVVLFWSRGHRLEFEKIPVSLSSLTMEEWVSVVVELWSAQFHKEQSPFQKLNTPFCIVKSEMRKWIHGLNTRYCTTHISLNITMIDLIIVQTTLKKSWFLSFILLSLSSDILYLLILRFFFPSWDNITKEQLGSPCSSPLLCSSQGVFELKQQDCFGDFSVISFSFS